jgi:hypothetical protein
MDLISRLWTPSPDGASRTAAIVAGTAVATAVTVSLLRSAMWPAKPKVIAGPLHTILPRLAEDELSLLEYTHDAFPGARDVQTPVRFHHISSPVIWRRRADLQGTVRLDPGL